MAYVLSVARCGRRRRLVGVVCVGDDKQATLSVRVDEATKRQLDTEEHVNTSALIRDLLNAYLLRGDAVEVGLERRIEAERKKLERLRLQKGQIDTDIEAQEHEIESLEQVLSNRRKSTPEEVIEFSEGVNSGRFTRSQLDAENAALKNWASKAGLPPERFISEVENRL